MKKIEVSWVKKINENRQFKKKVYYMECACGQGGNGNKKHVGVPLEKIVTVIGCQMLDKRETKIYFV